MRVFGNKRVGGLRREGMRVGMGGCRDGLAKGLFCDGLRDLLMNKGLFFHLGKGSV